MSGIDVVRTFLSLGEQGQGERIKQHLSGDFLLQGWTPHPLTKKQYLTLVDALRLSMPDLRFHARNFQEDNQLAQSDRVLLDIQLTGTQTARLLLPPYDIPPSSGAPRKLVLPQQRAAFTLMGQTVESLVFSPRVNILEQIIAQLAPLEAGRLPADAWPQPSAQGWSAASPEEAQSRYNKQSNLYDPQGGSFTPSASGHKIAPQIFPATGSQGVPTQPDVNA